MRNGILSKTTKTKARRAGFSLTELIIVMGVIGIVAAAIWAASSMVRGRQSLQDVVQIIPEIASRVRGVYTGHPNPPFVPVAVADQITGNFFPLSALNANRTASVNPWGGTIDIVFPAVPLYGFSVRVTLPNTLEPTKRRSACLGLISRLPGSATSYAIAPINGTTTGVLPDLQVKAEPAQGDGPSLVFVSRNGAWINVTGQDATAISNQLNGNECLGAAFYYKL